MNSPFNKNKIGNTIKQPTINQINIKPKKPWCWAISFLNLGKYLVVIFRNPNGKIVDTKKEKEYNTLVNPMASASKKNG